MLSPASWCMVRHQSPGSIWSPTLHFGQWFGQESSRVFLDFCPNHTQHFAIVHWTQNTLVSSRVISHHSDQDTTLHPALITTGSTTKISPSSSIHILYNFHAYYYCPISVSVLNWILNGGTALRRSEAELQVFLCLCFVFVSHVHSRNKPENTQHKHIRSCHQWSVTSRCVCLIKHIIL